MLSDIVRFSLPESYAPVSSRRSPQLTNGHGVGGEWECDGVDGMPLGDAFVQLMLKAWKAQDERARTTMMPRCVYFIGLLVYSLTSVRREVLARLGAKYDQYLDFRQQDAHEFLRHLLDAMRMEELDVRRFRSDMFGHGRSLLSRL